MERQRDMENDSHKSAVGWFYAVPPIPNPPTAPSALPAAGAVKIYLSYKFCGASRSLFLSLREQSQAQSQKNI